MSDNVINPSEKSAINTMQCNQIEKIESRIASAIYTEKGRFRRGNPGKPKGANHTLTAQFKAKILRLAMERDPKIVKTEDIFRIAATFVPKEVINSGDGLKPSTQIVVVKDGEKSKN